MSNWNIRRKGESWGRKITEEIMAKSSPSLTKNYILPDSRGQLTPSKTNTYTYTYTNVHHNQSAKTQ